MSTTRCPTPAQLSRAHAEGVAEPMASHVERCARCASALQGLSRLRELARELPYEEPSADRLRDVGRALLAQAEVVRPERRRVLPIAAAAGIGALAASVAAALWFAPGGPPVAPAAAPASLAEIGAAPGAVYEHVTHHPSTPGEKLAEVVRLSRGDLSLHVQHLGPGERFLVKCSDAEVEVRGTRFVVRVEDDRLQHVAVAEGKVEVRVQGREPLLLLPGDRWDRGEARAAIPAAAPVPAAPALAPGPVAAAAPLALRAVPAARRSAAPPAAPPPPSPAPAPPEAEPPAAEQAIPSPPAPSLAEAAFASGWDLLRSGEAAAAADRFAAVPDDDDLGGEAAYWRIVAQARAGQKQAATASMQRYLDRHGASPRSDEVHLMLGLRLLDEGDRITATRHLQRAALSPTPHVRESARKALEVMDVAE